MKELTSRKTGKPHYVSEEIYNKLVKKDQIRKYKVRDVKPLMTKAPQIIKPEPEVKKVTKSK